MAKEKKTAEAKSTIRQSNFELLRIVSIFFIILSHYTVHNGVLNWTLPLGPNRLLLELSGLGHIGVIIFILISGYFLGASKKEIRLSKLLKTVLHVLFFSSFIFIIFLVSGKEKLSFGNITKSFLPISFSTYWFITAYIVIYIFHPFINRFLNNLDRQKYKQFIFLSLIFLLLRTFLNRDMLIGDVGLFLIYYSIGNYLRIYKDNIFATRKIRTMLLLFSIIVIFASMVVLDIIGERVNISVLSTNSNILLVNKGSVFALAIGVSIFCSVGYAKNFSNRIINTLASVTFGIYLIHDNYLIRRVLWTDIFHNAAFVNSPWLIAHMVGTVTLVFIACGLIDFLRKITVGRFYDQKIAPKIDAMQDKKLFARHQPKSTIPKES